jgi:hypothetical protein
LDKVTCLGQPNCYRLRNDAVELIVTTDIGPRIIHYGFVAEENILAEIPAVTLQTEWGVWKPWGGHRLWAAPEMMPRTYSIDNDPVEFDATGELAIRLIQRAGPHTAGLEKQIFVTLDDHGSGVALHHKITNRNMWGSELAPWALTIMNGGGAAIVPQEPYLSHDECLVPARPMVLWHFTNLSDPRFRLGQKYVCVQCDPDRAEPQKIGIANKRGWVAYLRDGTLFLKRFAFDEGATYPDYGSNNEVYTAGSFMEIESLAPLRHLEPGESAEHIEHWELFRVQHGRTDTDAEIDKLLPRLVGPGENRI